MALLNVKVVPGARRTEIVGRYGDAIKLRVAAPPEDGRANQEVLTLLAEALGVDRRSLKIVRGQTSPQKVVDIAGLELAEILRRLGIAE